MSHSKISSTAEPWLLLPLLQMLKKEGTVTTYSHQNCQKAMVDIVSNMRGGKPEYNRLLKEFVESIYASTSKDGSIYFLDKTPRYYMIIPEIVELFPDAKFIFLFRNPVHVYASMLTTWGEGTLRRLFHHVEDLKEGPVLLANGYASIKDKAYALRYEEFVQAPKKHLESLLGYLGLEYEKSMLTSFVDQQPKGGMGDPTGVKAYNSIDTGSSEKWKSVFNNRFRKKLIKKYILGLPANTLAMQGYNKNVIVDEINNNKITRLTPLKDYYHYCRSVLILRFRLNFFLSEEMKWSVDKHLS